MSIFSIAWRSIQYRGLGSVLSVVSMGLGVMLVVAVLSIQAIVTKSFRSNTSFGYNVIVGSKGGKTQLTLNTVFYLSRPTGNIPYEYFLEFQDRDYRLREFENSIQYQHDQAVARTRELSLQQSPFGGGLTEIGLHLQNEILDQEFRKAARLEDSTRFAEYTGLAIPLALGDFLGTENNYFRVVGTTKQFFTDLELDVNTQEKFKFADGRAFEFYTKENRYFEAVLGARAARDLGIKVGDEINPIHGDPRTNPDAHIHEQPFKVVGVLAPTGTPHDRAVFINLEGFFLMEDHVKPIEDSGMDDDDEPDEDDEGFMIVSGNDRFTNQLTRVSLPLQENEKQDGDDADVAKELELKELMRTDGLDPLPIEQREVTAILVRTANDEFGLAAVYIDTAVNSNKLESTLNWSDYRPLKDAVNDAAEAANPIQEVTNLFVFFVDPIRWLLLILTSMICIVSGISILVGIYNSMSQRRHEVAVMRALGASRQTVMAITLVETSMLALAGGFVGWFAGHFLIWFVGSWVETYSGVRVGLFSIAPIEFVLFPGLLLLAILFGILPAIWAYRTDVAKSLGA